LGALNRREEAVLDAAKGVLLPDQRDLKQIQYGSQESAVEFAKQMGAGDFGDSVEAGGDLFETLCESGLEETAEGVAILAVVFTTGMAVKSGWKWLSELVMVPADQRKAAAKLKEEYGGLPTGCGYDCLGFLWFLTIACDFGIAAGLYFNI
jgi:hypothetical protein